MRLHEHPDFRDALIAAGAYFSAHGISAQLIEKDYYVTVLLAKTIKTSSWIAIASVVKALGIAIALHPKWPSSRV
jgi:hypothetical protein